MRIRKTIKLIRKANNLRNSIILIDKPAGKTSFETVKEIKRLTNIKKVGHSGTLDKFASGLLVIATGQATKLTRYFLEDDKSYYGIVKLGISTRTDDSEGEITERANANKITRPDIIKSANKFKGKIEQLPPIYSALKIKGRRASDLARKGEIVDLKERKVDIYDLDVYDVDLDNAKFSIKVRCSKGTYIRSLARDIGRDLDCGAHLESLRRTRSGIFCIGDAVTSDVLEEYINGRSINKGFIKKPGDALNNYGTIVVKERVRKRILNGVIFHIDDTLSINDKGEKIFIIFDEDENLIAIADIDIHKWHIKYLNVFRS